MSIRDVVPADFVIGVKVNASDYVDASFDSNPSPHHVNETAEHEKQDQESKALEHVRTIAGWHAVDFIEVSGGDYETPGKYDTIFCGAMPDLSTSAQSLCRRLPFQSPLVRLSSHSFLAVHWTL